MTALKVGGQCEGYGGIFEALRTLLPVEHAWYAETDAAASKVLAHHYPGVPNHGDITTYDWAAAEQVDVFTSGFPCTDISLAGKREGSEGKHFLWPTGVQPAVTALRPPLALFENVPNLLRIEGGQVFARILADLDDLGYTVSWTVIGACKVGACHHRHRVFVAATLVDTPAPLTDPVAHRAGEGWAPAQFVLFGDTGAVTWPTSGFVASGTVWELPVETCGFDGAALPTPRAIDGEVGQQTLVAGRTLGDRGPRLGDIGALLPTPRTSDTNGAGQHGAGGLDLRTAVAMLPTPVARDVKGANIRNDDSCLHGALLPTPVAGDADRASASYSRGNPTLLGAMLPTPTATPYGNNQSPSVGAAVRPSLDSLVQMLLTPRASDGEKGGPNQRGSSGDVMLPAAVQPERFGKYALAVHRHEVAYGLVAPDPTEPGRNGKPRLSPAFPEFMQGLAPGWLTDVVARKDALRLAGNGVNPRQAAYALPTLPTFRAAVAHLRQVEVAA